MTLTDAQPVLAAIPLTRIDGTETQFDAVAGQVTLIVNVASNCGLTPQYESLERLYAKHKADGLVVLGFPCNQFRDQEPGTENEIQEFCSTTYGVSFPLFAKLAVNGTDRHPLYSALVDALPEAIENPDGGMRSRLAHYGVIVPRGDIIWNFEKFLIGRDGTVIARFAPDITVDDPRLRTVIEHAISQPARAVTTGT
jgi:glutathione peroxidase